MTQISWYRRVSRAFPILTITVAAIVTQRKSKVTPPLKRAKMADAAETVNDLSKDAKFMDLYSRQIGTYGMEAMLKLVRMKVLLVGVRGVGVETAKNATLAGIHTLTLYAVRARAAC